MRRPPTIIAVNRAAQQAHRGEIAAADINAVIVNLFVSVERFLDRIISKLDW
jgi:hypothetical protein